MQGPFEPTYEDFDSGRVFDYICSIKNAYEQGMAERRMSAIAQEVKFKSFKRLLTLYKQNLREQSLPPVRVGSGLSDFGDQELELNTGDWTADEMGVYKLGEHNVPIVACSHPIMPYRRMRSVDTKAFKYILAYRRGSNQRKTWDFVDIDAADMASPTEIVKRLAPYGISVSGGDRARALVDYLRDVTDLNFDTIPEVKSVSRLGWNEEGFSPYAEGIQFDGAASFASAYEAIKQVGDYEIWKREALDARTYSSAARIVLAASFAAPLIEPLGILPFFVHLWSAASGTGKTVGQMLGASVWGDPNPGGAFFPTFRSTSVGFEMMAGFLHSLPLFIDELQLAKDRNGQIRFNVYELASGSGKLRSNKALGINAIPTWRMCFITSGESPIVSETDGEGALNRVLEIECYADQKVINDGLSTSNALRLNYGWAGRDFIERLQQDGQIEHAKELYDQFYRACVTSDTTEKQAMAASVLLVADKLATDWIFQDDRELTLEELQEFLKSKEQVSLMERGYQTILDWIAINTNRLRGIREDDKAECFGLVRDGVAYIIRTKFSEICTEYGLSEKGLLSHLRSKGLILTSGRDFTKRYRIGGAQPTNCVCIILPKTDDAELDEYVQSEQLPF